jgi:hypothetical protein
MGRSVTGCSKQTHPSSEFLNTVSLKEEIEMKAFCVRMIMVTLLTGLPLVQAWSDDGNHYGQYVRELVQVSNHHVFPAGPDVDGATILIRDFTNRIIRATITSAALEPDTAYSIWWGVFNYPEYCATPHSCTPGDLGNPAVRASVFWGGGFLADANGYTNTSLVLLPGKTDRELFANMSDAGLENFGGAEIHVVIRSHGPVGIAGAVADQIGTAFLACPGGNNCINAFASIHSSN